MWEWNQKKSEWVYGKSQKKVQDDCKCESPHTIKKKRN